MEKAIGFEVPIEPDSVLSPDVLYGDPVTGIYFITDDDQYGRITFENLDSLRVSRGECLPYEEGWDIYADDAPYYWVTQIQNSNWLKERHEYESRHYGNTYEFGGNVDEMLTDFNHYVFSFHDEFVEVLARGIWFEKSSEKLMGKPLSEGHPFLPLPQAGMMRIEAHGLSSQVRVTTKNEDELKRDAVFCSHPIMEFALELDGSATVDHHLLLFYRSGRLMSRLGGFFGKPIAEFEGIATLEDVRPYIEAYMKEVADRRNQQN